jgi:hypothetical protein
VCVCVCVCVIERETHTTVVFLCNPLFVSGQIQCLKLCCLALNVTTINKDWERFAEDVVLGKSQVLYLHSSEGSEKIHKNLSG